MAGTLSMVTPSAADAVSAEVRLVLSAVLTSDTVVLGGTVIVAMMITLAAITEMATLDGLTPAAVAIFWRRPRVSA